ncbi:MAG: hypothetical protein AB1730_22150 [Myxococcota bacterium]
MLNSVAEQRRTTVFTEEVELLDVINTHAEYSFEVTPRDETRTSGQIDVPSP